MVADTWCLGGWCHGGFVEMSLHVAVDQESFGVFGELALHETDTSIESLAHHPNHWSQPRKCSVLPRAPSHHLVHVVIWVHRDL